MYFLTLGALHGICEAGRISDCRRIAAEYDFDPALFPNVTTCALLLLFARTYFENKK